MPFIIVPKKMKYIYTDLIQDLYASVLNAQKRNQRKPT